VLLKVEKKRHAEDIVARAERRTAGTLLEQQKKIHFIVFFQKESC